MRALPWGYPAPSEIVKMGGRLMVRSMAFPRLLVFALVLLVMAGCRTAPVYNVQSSDLGASPRASLAAVTQAIKRAGIGLGWQMSEDGPGRITGRLALRSHVAVVGITYDTRHFSISYRDSTNLKYDGSQIHNNYNEWVRNLEQAIRVEASSI